MSSPDDFAPGGSDRVKRSNLSRPEQLPPGRRNQPTERPVNPRAGALARIEALSNQEQPVPPPARKRASRAIQPAALPLAEPAPEPEVEARPRRQVTPDARNALAEAIAGSDDFAAEFYDEQGPRVSGETPTSDATIIAALAEAVMVGMRCRIVGEQPGATWEQFDEAAEEALLLLTPVDPYEKMSNVERFVWGDTGLMRLPEQVTSGEEIADVLRLGEYAREVQD